MANRSGVSEGVAVPPYGLRCFCFYNGVLEKH